ncbi:PREDICTED: uncharacterized protein LOC109343510 isoform X2 [Lupinus angustifolius]|uniref:uncharacterized protein LOC109343510 isoform X2 n=1 Tax=Lupinus angustifolius TaxID=3871 RepID=UPI00092E62FC|nr:PREDICTED: uncharacterized protein LOC109343510 isoform X2 [Lupinus angustifolius]
MPRSSKHKSSKHSSRDASEREYSDSERDSGVKYRKSKEESAAAAKVEKRRVVDSKEGEYSDDYGGGSSKRRKDGSGDRWNGGGGDNDRGESTKKDSKSSRRREEEGEEVKRSGGKHNKDSSGRKESRESERKLKDRRSEELVDVVDGEEQQQPRVSKQVFENNSDSRKIDELRSPEFDNQLERRMRKRRDDYDDGGKLQDDAGDAYGQHKDETVKDGKKRDDRRKDDKYRDKYRAEMDKENKHRHDKQRDERPSKGHASIRLDDKHAREEKNSSESRQKRTKLPESDRDHNRDRDGEREWDHDFEYVCDRERRSERDRGRDYDYDRDQDYDCDRDYHDRDRDRERGRHRDRDGSHLDDRSAKSKEGGAKKRTLDDLDEYSDSKSRVVKSHYSDAEKRSLSNSRADSDIDRGRSQPHQAHADSIGTSNKHRSSPASNSHIGRDEYRNANAEDPKYRDSTIEQRTKFSREGYSGISERAPKYKLIEKSTKIGEGPVAELSTERSSCAKASPMGLMERSPSSTSIERRYVNKSGVKRSVDARDDDRLGRELTLEKLPLDEPSRADSSFYARTSQSNASLVPPPPAFRVALDRPYMVSLEDDVRDNSNNRYRRNSEPGFGRVHGGNSWRAVPNWTSPIPNGFVPFPPGPAHGGFHTMMPQFTSQSIFGVRPPMDHAGIPYHIADGDRFHGHLRPPIGWQNMMDGTVPAHLHGWDSNNGIIRDDPHMYGGSDWDRNRHSTNSHGWESGSETWNEQNSDSKKDLSSPTCKEESIPTLVDNGVTDQSTKISLDERNWDEFHEKSPETKLASLNFPTKIPLNSSSRAIPEKVPDMTQSDSTSFLSRFYLLKLDISEDLVLPELYNQCMCALNTDKNASIDVDASTQPFLKNDRRAQQRYAATLSRQFLFPEINNSVFQRAMDIYKKQRVKLPNEGELDIIAPSNQMEVDDSLPASSLDNKTVSIPASEGTTDVLIPALELEKMKASSPANDHLDHTNQTCNQMEQDYDSTHSPKMDIAGQSSVHENQEEAVTALCENEDKVTSNTVKSSDEEENYSLASKSEAVLAQALQEDDDNMNSKATTCGDDTKVNLLILEDGSPKVCDGLMPGSNESESLILSRIHHSPESTH